MPQRQVLAVALALAATRLLQPQSVGSGGGGDARPSSLIVPQCRVFPGSPGSGLKLTRVDAGAVIVERAATVTLDMEIANTGRTREEAELLIPIPDCSAVRGFTFHGTAAEARAEVLESDAARAAYRAIVSRLRDPALLEFAGHNLVRSSVFPVEPGGTQKVRLTYEQVLPSQGNRIDFALPRSQMLREAAPWTISVKVQSKTPILTAYSPSHAVETSRSPGALSVRLSPAAAREPGPFLLSWLLEPGEAGATLFAYPDARIGGGYFLLLAGLPASLGQGSPRIPREVTLVLDRSGSMRGEKFEQAREAALQIISALDDGEHFNIIAFSDTVEPFAPVAVRKTAESVRGAHDYLRGLQTLSGTNIHDALVEALRQKPPEGALPLVLFLTDGLPTVGITAEAEIRKVALEGNPHARRIFTFGVGVDVNTPLLEKIASGTRAAPTFVLPGEDVEVKVAGVFQKLQGPVLADPRLETPAAVGAAIAAGGPRVREMLPARLPDLFQGDQVVVLGQYRGTEALTFRLAGKDPRGPRVFEFHFELASASTRHAFVPRLWASRKIADLVDAIRNLDASHAAPAPSSIASAAPPADPRLRELVDEVVRLSTEFGILSEYTAFLATEGTDLAARDRVLAEALGNFVNRAIHCRSGVASVNQELNQVAGKAQSALKLGNNYLDANLKEVVISGVQQVSDLAFYKKGSRWVDSRLAAQAAPAPARTVIFGSEEYFALLGRLVTQGRQGLLSFPGDILVQVEGETVLVRSDPAEAAVDGFPAKP